MKWDDQIDCLPRAPDVIRKVAHWKKLILQSQISFLYKYKSTMDEIEILPRTSEMGEL